MAMNEATTEQVTLTEVLVRHAIYTQHGFVRIAIDDNTLADLMDNNTVTATPQDVSLLEESGSPAWVDRMVRIRSSLAGVVKELRDGRDRQTRYLERLGEALLEQAEERGWCEEYDAFAEEWGLPARVKEFEVTMTVRVRACDEDAAIEIVKGGVLLDSYRPDSVVGNPEYSADEA